MNNVITLKAPSRVSSQEARFSALLDSFAMHRRGLDDVFWLKENAEVLNIMESSGVRLGADALAGYAEFYGKVERRMQFFPQYYRFFLGITLDLEDLGMPGTSGEALVRFAKDAASCRG